MIPSTVEDLESMVIDESAEPKALPLSLLDEITCGFSEKQEIGRGGFAVVYEGSLLNVTVAVKKLTNLHMRDAPEVEYNREVECLMRVKHKNIVRFLGYCADTQGSIARFNERIVMADVQNRLLCFEYVPNRSLRDYITDASHGLEWRRRYLIIKGVCDGLNYLHENNIVHLDLKPENILMDENMNPKITDFGLSRCFDVDQSKAPATKVVGTMGYMPPEFYSSRVITRTHDIYSLGIIISEILTGEKGYHQTEDVVDSWRKRLEVSNEACVLEQIRLCANIGIECTEYNPAKRPCSVQDIIDRLEETESADESSAEQMSSPMPTVRGLLHVPQDQLRFPLFDPDKDVFSPMRLTNNTNDHIAFRCFPKFPGSFIGKLSKLSGIVPPRSTRTFLVWMEKQPPENIEKIDMVLESCVAHKAIENMEDNFLQEIREQVGGKVHQVPLVAVCNPAGETIQSQIKIICRMDFLVAMDVHPTEPWVLVGQYDGLVSIWNYETQKKLTEVKIVEGPLVRSSIFIAREDWIVAGDGHGVIHVRSCKTLGLEEVKKFKAHDGWIQALAVHPSLPLMVSGGCYEGLVKLWDWGKDWTCLRTFKAHRDKVEALQFNPQNDTPDCVTFASGAPDGKAMIWDIKLTPPIAMLDCQMEQVMDLDYFLPGGNEQYIITGCIAGNTRIWDLRTHKCVRVIKGTSIGSAGCRARVVYRHPDPQLLIRTFQDESLGLCNTTTFRYAESINFGLEKCRNIVYVKSIRSVVIGFTKGLAILEIN